MRSTPRFPSLAIRGACIFILALTFLSSHAQSNGSVNSIPNQYESTGSPAPGAKVGGTSVPGQYETTNSVLNGNNKPSQAPSQYDVAGKPVPGAKVVSANVVSNPNVPEKTKYFEDQAKRQTPAAPQINHSTSKLPPQPNVYNKVNQYEQKAGLPSSWDKPAPKTSAPGSAVQQPTGSAAPPNGTNNGGTYQALPKAPANAGTNTQYQQLEKVPASSATKQTTPAVKSTPTTTNTSSNAAQAKAGTTSTTNSKSGPTNSSGGKGAAPKSTTPAKGAGSAPRK